MKTNRFIGLALSTAALFTLDGPAAQAQFYRGGTNPYNQSSGGGGVIFMWNPGFVRGPAALGMSMFPLLAANSMMMGANQSNAYGGRSWGSNSGNGYSTGGAGGYYRYNPSRVTPVAPGSAVAPEAPRKAFERWAQGANGQDAQRKQAELHRSLTNPAPADIASGAALNAILDGLEPLAAKLKSLPPTEIDEAFLARLNFTRGTGSVGMLRNKGKIAWPALLVNVAPKEEAAKVRQQIETRFKNAFDQVAAGGAADTDNLKALTKSIEQLGDLAGARAQAMTFAENVEVKRFLRGLEDGVAFLKQTDAADWLPGTRKAHVKTLQQLVLRMLDQKVRFGPAAAGHEAVNATMLRALAALYNRATAPQVGVNRK